MCIYFEQAGACVSVEEVIQKTESENNSQTYETNEWIVSEQELGRETFSPFPGVHATERRDSTIPD